MANDDGSFEAMLRERSELRGEIALLIRGQQQAILAFVTVLIFVGGVHWGEGVVPDPKTRSHVLFFLTQIEMFFMFYMMALFSNLGVHSRYIAALEQRINNLCGNDVNLWESRVSLACLFHPRGTFLWSIVAMLTLALALFVFILVITFQQINSFLYGAVFSLEIVAFIALLVYLVLEPSRTARFIESSFRETIRSQQPPERDE